MLGQNGGKFFHLPRNYQVHPAPFFVIGINTGGFLHAASAIAFGIDLQGYFSLAAGGDLSRIRDRRAPSAGLDAIHRQRCITLVLNDKVVHDPGIFQNRGKVISRFREKDRSGGLALSAKTNPIGKCQ